MSYRRICALAFVLCSFSASAQELFSYELPISYQRGGVKGDPFIKCEVSSRIVDGIRYYLVDLTRVSGWHKYGGSRVEDAETYSADQIRYVADGIWEGRHVRMSTEFVLDPSNGRVHAALLRETDFETGEEYSSAACLQNVSS